MGPCLAYICILASLCFSRISSSMGWWVGRRSHFLPPSSSHHRRKKDKSMYYLLLFLFLFIIFGGDDGIILQSVILTTISSTYWCCLIPSWTLLQNQPSGEGGARSPPATPHRLQNVKLVLLLTLDRRPSWGKGDLENSWCPHGNKDDLGWVKDCKSY